MCAEDLRLRAGAGGGAGQAEAHDAGGGDPVLPSARDPHGGEALLVRRGRLERGLHIRGAAGPEDPVPSPEPRAAAGAHHGAAGHALAGGHAVRVRRRPLAHDAPPAQAAVPCGALHAVVPGHPRGGAPALPNARLRPGQEDHGGGRAGAPVPGRGPAAVPLVHVQVLLHDEGRHAAVHGRLRARGQQCVR